MEQSNTNETYLTVRQVQTRFGIGRTTLWHMRKRGEIKAYRPGKRRKLLFKPSELVNVIRPVNENDGNIGNNED